MRTSFVLFGLTILAGINGSASLTLTVNNPNQIVVPGAHAVYSGTLTNTDSVAYTVVLFSAINPPTDATTPPTASQLFPIAEPAVPFNIAAGGQVAGVIMDITVPATAQLRNHSFAVEAVTSSHDTAGNSIVSNFAALNLTVALPNSYQLLTTIPIPGNLTGGFDISWVDTASGRYYLADRGTGSVDVIDAERDQYLYSIGGFVGSKGRGVSGPDGVLVIHKEHELWAGDGDSTVKVVDLKAGANAVPFAISTGGTKRADELAYDPIDHIIIIANDSDDPPFVTFISQETRKVLGKLPYPQATGGLEQPVWDQRTKKFYMSVPSTTANPQGEVDEIDPHQRIVTRVFPGTCNPAGLALIPRQRLMTSCGDVLSVKTGAVVTTVPGVGADEIWFNQGDGRVYFGNDNLAVVDAETYQVITTIAVGSTHSVAADSENNHVFVPVTGVGVKVYAQPDDE
jgi:hypothetical protein